MATKTAFGPQGFNIAKTLPGGVTANRHGSGVDTWVRDASSPGACDGTILNADFFNMILGNMRHAVRSAGVPLDDGDMTLLHQAIVAIASDHPVESVGAGLKLIDKEISLRLGDGSLPTHTS